MAQIGPDTLGSDTAVDLTNCDREPIHVIGRVQSFGALISMSSDWIINHASVNMDRFLGKPAQDLIGRRVADANMDSDCCLAVLKVSLYP